MKLQVALLITLGLLAAQCMHAADVPAPLSIPVRVHLVRSDQEVALTTTLTDDDVRRVLGKVNTIWAQAGIRFVIESIGTTQALNQQTVKKDEADRWVVAAMPGERLLKKGLNVFYVKELTPNGFYSNGLIFVKDTAKLSEVPGGIDEPLPRVTAHELGHALGLPHRQDVTNLMASGKTGFSLNAQEIDIARASALAMLPFLTAEDGKERK